MTSHGSEPRTGGPSPTSRLRRKSPAGPGGNDEADYERLVEPHRAELHAHCYRMLGSIQDADDALQDALLRAWRGLARFEGRSSLRSWLYTIATNTCLDLIARRPRRGLPPDQGPAADPRQGPGEPMAESVWLEPYPDANLGLGTGLAAPEASYERRESVELAFVAALQHLPARQRAVLILREVLGFTAGEVAEMLATTAASVNSALQRARKTVQERVPEQSQQVTLRSLGDERVREIVEGYIHAWERGDVHAVVAMLTEDAAFAMPPLRTWYRGREAIALWMAGWPLGGDWRWRHVPSNANGQAAVGCYSWDAEARGYLPFALEVLTFRGAHISEVTAFVVRSTQVSNRQAFARWPEQPADPRTLTVAFDRFGLPDRLD